MNFDPKQMSDDELKSFIQEDYARFCAGQYDDNDDRIIEVFHELERREERRTPPPNFDELLKKWNIEITD